MSVDSIHTSWACCRRKFEEQWDIFHTKMTVVMLPLNRSTRIQSSVAKDGKQLSGRFWQQADAPLFTRRQVVSGFGPIPVGFAKQVVSQHKNVRCLNLTETDPQKVKRILAVDEHFR